MQPIGGQHFIEGLTLNLSRSGALIRMVSNGSSHFSTKQGDALWGKSRSRRTGSSNSVACPRKAIAVRVSEEKEGGLWHYGLNACSLPWRNPPVCLRIPLQKCDER